MPLRLVVLGAAGYFVDIFDLFLFSVLRVPSLEGIGVSGDQILSSGVFLLNCQMAGLFVGSFFWGILGDKLGRVRVLYGSILLYSLATLANAAVTSVDQYAVCRVLAGIGLAGELGAAITLVVEAMSREKRGLGTTIVAAVGLCGGVAASLLSEHVPWRHCYVIGGCAGLLLLALRVKLQDAEMFLAIRGQSGRGDLRLLFGNFRRLSLYLRLVVIGVPIYYVSGLLMVFSPELGRLLGLEGGPPTAAKAILYSYLGVAIGDLLCGLLSQRLQLRKVAMNAFLGVAGVGVALYFSAAGRGLGWFYSVCFVLGIGTGYWAVLITAAAESFGTNLRATVATTVPNLVRASVIPVTLFFKAEPSIARAAWLGAGCFVLAAIALATLPETYGKELAFVDE